MPGFDREQMSRAEEGQPESTELKEGEDYYLEGPYVVFTAKYLLRCGACCNSGCRHCPYRTGETPSEERESDKRPR